MFLIPEQNPVVNRSWGIFQLTVSWEWTKRKLGHPQCQLDLKPSLWEWLGLGSLVLLPPHQKWIIYSCLMWMNHSNDFGSQLTTQVAKDIGQPHNRQGSSKCQPLLTFVHSLRQLWESLHSTCWSYSCWSSLALDVPFCLKKKEKGSRPVWNPNAALVNTWGHLVLQFWFYFLYKTGIIECKFYFPKVF